jgi:hypothetical protein
LGINIGKEEQQAWKIGRKEEETKGDMPNLAYTSKCNGTGYCTVKGNEFSHEKLKKEENSSDFRRV